MTQPRLLQKIYWISATLAFFVLIFLGSVVFLHPSSVGNPRFVSNINLWAVIWALLFVVVLTLSFVLARNLIKLFFEDRDDRLGNRIRNKLVATLIIFSLFPALVMAFLAFGLMNQNLRQWFSSPSEQLLSSSQVVADSYYAQDRVFRLLAADFLAQQIQTGQFEASTFEDLYRQYGFDGALIVDAAGTVTPVGEWPSPAPPESVLRQVLGGEQYYALERRIDVDDGVVGVPVVGAGGSRALFVHHVIPQSVAFHNIQVDEASEKYQAIKEGVRQLELNYFAILGLTTLAVMFGFVWLGTYIARRITVPLEALAEGSGQLAAGNLDHRVDVSAVDELGVLVDSFNQMALEIKQSRQQLEETNQQLRETNAQLDERRRYIETVLHNIATGVISLDDSGVVRTINEAALKMLQVDRRQILNQALQEAVDPQLFQQLETIKKSARLHGTYRREVTFKQRDRELHVATTATLNLAPMRKEAEYLIVLDDLTELIRAEKVAAWQEVARRLAHEIKNPLTPIRLSAERVQKRFLQVGSTLPSLPEIRGFEKVLSDSMKIIVAEAEILRSLVEEFSRFARLPICKPVETLLHPLIEQTLSRYDGSLQKVRVHKSFDSTINRVKLDPKQMQRAFVNLLDNSLDALSQNDGDPYILIRTVYNDTRRSVSIEFQDNGVGIAPHDYENLFLPYFSTKKKGTGLGLVIVRQIISEHSGFVRAEPNQPQGTRLIIELPLN